MTTRMTRAAGRELGIVPRLAWGLAALVFAVSVGLFGFLFGGFRPSFTPMPWLMGTFAGAGLALIVIAAGYVNRDAARRGMSPTLWTVLVLVIPNAIGFILYFILRSPVRVPCPACGTAMAPDASYCSKCGRELGPVCRGCGRRIGDDDRFCPACGRPVESGQEQERAPVPDGRTPISSRP